MPCLVKRKAAIAESQNSDAGLGDVFQSPGLMVENPP